MRLQLQKERLTTFVVHDLKNPLNAMDLHTQILLNDLELHERTRASVQGIRKGIRSLLRLILNLLDISKSEEGQLGARISDVDLDLLVSEVLDTHDLTSRARLTLSRAINVRTLRDSPCRRGPSPPGAR